MKPIVALFVLVATVMVRGAVINRSIPESDEAVEQNAVEDFGSPFQQPVLAEREEAPNYPDGEDILNQEDSPNNPDSDAALPWDEEAPYSPDVETVSPQGQEAANSPDLDPETLELMGRMATCRAAISRMAFYCQECTEQRCNSTPTFNMFIEMSRLPLEDGQMEQMTEVAASPVYFEDTKAALIDFLEFLIWSFIDWVDDFLGLPLVGGIGSRSDGSGLDWSRDFINNALATNWSSFMMGQRGVDVTDTLESAEGSNDGNANGLTKAQRILEDVGNRIKARRNTSADIGQIMAEGGRRLLGMAQGTLARGRGLKTMGEVLSEGSQQGNNANVSAVDASSSPPGSPNSVLTGLLVTALLDLAEVVEDKGDTLIFIGEVLNGIADELLYAADYVNDTGIVPPGHGSGYPLQSMFEDMKDMMANISSGTRMTRPRLGAMQGSWSSNNNTGFGRNLMNKVRDMLEGSSLMNMSSVFNGRNWMKGNTMGREDNSGDNVDGLTAGNRFKGLRDILMGGNNHGEFGNIMNGIRERFEEGSSQSNNSNMFTGGRRNFGNMWSRMGSRSGQVAMVANGNNPSISALFTRPNILEGIRNSWSSRRNNSSADGGAIPNMAWAGARNALNGEKSNLGNMLTGGNPLANIGNALRNRSQLGGFGNKLPGQDILEGFRNRLAENNLGNVSTIFTGNIGNMFPGGNKSGNIGSMFTAVNRLKAIADSSATVAIDDESDSSNESEEPSGSSQRSGRKRRPKRSVGPDDACLMSCESCAVLRKNIEDLVFSVCGMKGLNFGAVKNHISTNPTEQ